MAHQYMSVTEAKELYTSMLSGSSLTIPSPPINTSNKAYQTFKKYRNPSPTQIINLLTGQSPVIPPNINRSHMNHYDIMWYERTNRLPANIYPNSLAYKPLKAYEIGMRQGHWTELHAIKWFKSFHKYSHVRKVHYLANPLFPGWFESPDGIVFHKGKAIGTIEVKSVHLPVNITVRDFIHGNYKPWNSQIAAKPIFAPNTSGRIDMKQSEKGITTLYQIQAGLLISNLPWCEFIIVNSRNPTEIESIRIMRDDTWYISKSTIAQKVWKLINQHIAKLN